MANQLIRREPMREMLSLREAMDRLFEESFVGPRFSLLGDRGSEGSLAVDMYETDDNIVVTAAVPGIKPEDLDISITGDMLSLKGETTFEEKVEKANYIRQEMRYGKFQRMLSLPVDVEADKAEATFENGILTLKLPKAESVKPKTIKITAK